MTQEVKGCGSCPYSYIAMKWIHQVWKCSHPNAPKDDDVVWENENLKNSVPPPEWCPLRQESITISLIL